jgi:hypothetical protein
MLAEQYAHFFLFECECCKHNIVVSRVFDERNLEIPDGIEYELQCDCGWSATMTGALSRKHLVMPWEDDEDTTIVPK